METGYLQDLQGHAIARNVIQWIRVIYDQNLVFQADTSSGIAANPFFEFYLRATVSGLVQVTWLDDAKQSGEYARLLTVLP
jgi:sulfur-oxidizing protein SoxZ